MPRGNPGKPRIPMETRLIEQLRALAQRMEGTWGSWKDREVLRAAADALAAADQDWMTPFEGSGIDWHEKQIGWKYTYQQSDFGKLVVAVHEYEVRSLKAEAECDRLAAELAQAREAIEQARVELRGPIADIIAIKGHLDTPYPDDPRWTPWTRFAERALRRIDHVREALAAVLRCEGQPESRASGSAPDGETA